MRRRAMVGETRCCRRSKSICGTVLNLRFTASISATRLINANIHEASRFTTHALGG